MQKIKRLLALLLVVALTVTQLPVAALASGTAHTAVNTTESSSGGNDLQTVVDTVYNAGQEMVLASTGEEGGSGFQYALSLKIELKELESSLSVQANTYSLDSDASGGELVVTLYENENGIPKLIDLFTAEVPSGVQEDTPDTPEASGVLSFAGVDPENLVVSGVICRSLDEPLPLSAAVSYDANGFILVPASISTLAATEVTKTSAVLHGQVAVEVGTELNAADFGFLVFNSLESEVEEEMDEDGNPIGVILPDALPAASITSDGRFSLPLTNLESGQEYQYMAVSKGKVAAYGEPMGVTTKSDLPAVETNASPTIDSEN
ncbi:MAG: hypothetical protein GX820_03125, partial [Bacteroidales bacterium]|nr:hypothetical protein [Bacteroidales bacterium]